MSGHLYDETESRNPTQVVWAGRVAKTVTDFATLLDVIIPGIDDTIVWRGCKWQARNTIDFPQRDDLCIVLFDDNNELWVVAWWPF